MHDSTPRPIDLDDRERLTLADAIDAYRGVRSLDKEWLRVPFGQRLSPHDLDSLRKSLLEGIDDEDREG